MTKRCVLVSRQVEVGAVKDEGERHRATFSQKGLVLRPDLSLCSEVIYALCYVGNAWNSLNFQRTCAWQAPPSEATLVPNAIYHPFLHVVHFQGIC